MGEPSFVSLPSLLNIRCVVVMGGFGQGDYVVRDGSL
jgi:phosphoribosylformylglycinamidine (FGAM) synthase-like amidotransferase family enzyme